MRDPVGVATGEICNNVVIGGHDRRLLPSHALTHKYLATDARRGELVFRGTFGYYTIEGLRRSFGRALWDLVKGWCGE